MSPREVADHAGFSVDHVRHMIRKGQIKAVKKPMPFDSGYYYDIPLEEANKLKNRVKDNRGVYTRKKKEDSDAV